LVYVDGNNQMVIQQDMMAEQIVFEKINATLEDIDPVNRRHCVNPLSKK